MSSPEPATSNRTSRWRLALRAFGAVAFGVLGVTIVWQGFGLAGFGTDDHPLRNFAAFVPLFVAGWLALRPATKWLVRGVAVFLALGLAVAEWWLVPSKFDGMSLRDAVARRDQLRVRLASPSVEDMESGIVIKLKIDELRYQYRTLSWTLDADMKRWVDEVAAAITVRFRQIPPEDVETGRAFEERTRKFSIQFPGTMAVHFAAEDWVTRAIAVKLEELEDTPRGDWAAFDRTADGRDKLAATGYVMLTVETRETLMKAELNWVNESVEAQIERVLASSGEKGPRAGTWSVIERDVLALRSLDTSEARFQSARHRLFDIAYASAWHDTNQHIKAGRNNRAFSIARQHAVAWNATATLLGRSEVKKLDALREKCEALVVPGMPDPGDVDEPEPLPPPRVKPDK